MNWCVPTPSKQSRAWPNGVSILCGKKGVLSSQRPTSPTSATANNRLLATLTRPTLEQLRPHLEHVDLPLKRVLFDVNVPIEHVYFLESGVASVLGVMTDGAAVEVATVGNEGLVGHPVVLGADRMPCHAFMQVPGSGLRMRSDALRPALETHPELRHLLGRYTQALFTLVAQGAACNRIHSMGQRCARWLLMTHDRVDGDEFELTQAFLAMMLGVRRATVNAVGQQLQDQGLIRYVRGVVTVLDRQRLEEASCECYGIVRSEFARLIEGRTLESPLADLITQPGMTDRR
ncbi:MAG: transcriptional regulator, Crp/Fnr family [Myxococcaceae bacterium]|nr:transcriptional regulator, Crp/Fnr family [Myxococcaceae bacterium]